MEAWVTPRLVIAFRGLFHRGRSGRGWSCRSDSRRPPRFRVGRVTRLPGGPTSVTSIRRPRMAPSLRAVGALCVIPARRTRSPPTRGSVSGGRPRRTSDERSGGRVWRARTGGRFHPDGGAVCGLRPTGQASSLRSLPQAPAEAEGWHLSDEACRVGHRIIRSLGWPERARHDSEMPKSGRSGHRRLAFTGHGDDVTTKLRRKRLGHGADPSARPKPHRQGVNSTGAVPAACMRGGCSPICTATPAGGRLPLWQYAVFAAVIYSRAAAERLAVSVEEVARRVAARQGLKLTA